MPIGIVGITNWSAVERSSPVNYDNAGEQSLQLVTPLVAVLAVVNTFVMALLAVAFITDTGISYVIISSACSFHRRLRCMLINFAAAVDGRGRPML